MISRLGLLVSVTKCCFVIVVTILGCLEYASQIFYSGFPLAIILPLVLSLIICYLRVPPPEPKAVNAILGCDLKLESSATKGDYFLKTVAHRGAGLDAPENSLKAFNLCAERGCDVVEFDITLSSDNIPVVFHDETLERMTDCSLSVASMTLSELSGLDISKKHPFGINFEDTKIPTLYETVDLLLRNGQRMFIDIKDNNYKMTKVINDLFIKKPDLYSRAVVSSFFPNLIYAIRRNDSKIVCSLAYRPHYFGHEVYTASGGPRSPRKFPWYIQYCFYLCDMLHEWLLPRITFYLLGLSAVLLHKDVISPKLIADWEAKGVRVIVWTVNHPVEKQLFARVLKVTYMTDTLTAESSTHANSSAGS